jgi:hypothetical protein
VIVKPYEAAGSVEIQALADLLNEFSLGMSKAQVCRQMTAHPAYRFSSATQCPNIDDWVTVNAPQATDLPAKVGLVFRSGAVSAMWTKFPSPEFDSISAAIQKKHGGKRWQKSIAVGDCGATLANQMAYWHTKDADIYLDRFNENENGEMMGWLSFNTPYGFPFEPQACLEHSRASAN